MLLVFLATINQGTPPPAVVVDYGAKPRLIAIDDDMVDVLINNTRALLHTTGTVYNADIAYSDANQIYGGADTNNEFWPSIGISAIEPTFIVSPTLAVFANTSTTYNQPAVQYSSSSQIYGGVGKVNNSSPQYKIEDIRPSFLKVGNVN